MIEQIRAELFARQDIAYRAFQSKLLPTVAPERIIGVRTPAARELAKQYAAAPDISDFLEDLPHRYFDENNLHAFILAQIRDYDECIRRINAFLPYVDNWATCDQLRPKCFAKNSDKLLGEIEGWIASEKCYSVRFGVGMLMAHYLKDAYRPRLLEMVAEIQSDEYYVRMMIAWYFATALVYQYDDALEYLKTRKLDPWVHSKAIQKATESFRISDAQKALLKTLR